MTKMKTELAHRFNRNQVLPLIGETFIDANGIIEVESKEIALELQGLGIGFTCIVDDEEVIKEKKTEVEKIKPQVTEENISKNSDGDIGGSPELDIMKASLSSKSLEELKDLAEASGFKKVEWVRRNTQESMVEYLAKKLS